MMVGNFNPRTHRGVRLRRQSEGIRLSNISIHAPIVGCDLTIKELITYISRISIHAPIVGCDGGTENAVKVFQNFNPRTHRGVRL